MGFYSREELLQIGFKSIGKNVMVSTKASIYSPSLISLGNNVRIDDFCILSGEISIGNYIHIAAYTALYGGEAGIQVEDFANISSRICIYAVSDDYSGETMTSPMVPDKYKNLRHGHVLIKKHVIIGTSSTVMPGCTIGEGCALGAYSFIKESCPAWGIYVGIPCKRIGERSQKLLELEQKFLNED